MLRRRMPTRPGLMLGMLALLLTGCGSVSTSYLPPPEPARIPPLPTEARQPTIPSECLPTCSKRLTAERESWLNMPIKPASPASPVSGPMGH